MKLISEVKTVIISESLTGKNDVCHQMSLYKSFISPVPYLWVCILQPPKTYRYLPTT
jgi:hypothetical protein